MEREDTVLGSGAPKVESSAELTYYSVDSFCNGISIGAQKLPEGVDPRSLYALTLEEDTTAQRLRSRYALHKEEPLHKLETNLMRLSRRGVLAQSVIYFGTTSDPFYPFEGKFDASMKFLELFRRYTPGMLHIQTRSPLLVIALPILASLGNRVSVTIGIETFCEATVAKYTPSLPSVEERLKVVRALRRFGVEVTLQVAPVLPYGDWRKDAGQFADLLVENSDYLYIEPLTDGTPEVERRISAMSISKKLAEARKFHWLRPDTANPLITAVEERAPEKLLPPKRPHLKAKQLDMFAA